MTEEVSISASKESLQSRISKLIKKIDKEMNVLKDQKTKFRKVSKWVDLYLQSVLSEVAEKLVEDGQIVPEFEEHLEKIGQYIYECHKWFCQPGHYSTHDRFKSHIWTPSHTITEFCNRVLVVVLESVSPTAIHQPRINRSSANARLNQLTSPGMFKVGQSGSATSTSIDWNKNEFKEMKIITPNYLDLYIHSVEDLPRLQVARKYIQERVARRSPETTGTLLLMAILLLLIVKQEQILEGRSDPELVPKRSISDNMLHSFTSNFSIRDLDTADIDSITEYLTQNWKDDLVEKLGGVQNSYTEQEARNLWKSDRFGNSVADYLLHKSLQRRGKKEDILKRLMSGLSQTKQDKIWRKHYPQADEDIQLLRWLDPRTVGSNRVLHQVQKPLLPFESPFYQVRSLGTLYPESQEQAQAYLDELLVKFKKYTKIVFDMTLQRQSKYWAESRNKQPSEFNPQLLDTEELKLQEKLKKFKRRNQRKRRARFLRSLFNSRMSVWQNKLKRTMVDAKVKRAVRAVMEYHVNIRCENTNGLIESLECCLSKNSSLPRTVFESLIRREMPQKRKIQDIVQNLLHMFRTEPEAVSSNDFASSGIKKYIELVQQSHFDRLKHRDRAEQIDLAFKFLLLHSLCFKEEQWELKKFEKLTQIRNSIFEEPTPFILEPVKSLWNAIKEELFPNLGYFTDMIYTCSEESTQAIAKHLVQTTLTNHNRIWQTLPHSELVVLFAILHNDSLGASADKKNYSKDFIKSSIQNLSQRFHVNISMVKLAQIYKICTACDLGLTLKTALLNYMVLGHKEYKRYLTLIGNNYGRNENMNRMITWVFKGLHESVLGNQDCLDMNIFGPNFARFLLTLFTKKEGCESSEFMATIKEELNRYNQEGLSKGKVYYFDDPGKIDIETKRCNTHQYSLSVICYILNSRLPKNAVYIALSQVDQGLPNLDLCQRVLQGKPDDLKKPKRELWTDQANFVQDWATCDLKEFQSRLENHSTDYSITELSGILSSILMTTSCSKLNTFIKILSKASVTHAVDTLCSMLDQPTCVTPPSISLETNSLKLAELVPLIWSDLYLLLKELDLSRYTWLNTSTGVIANCLPEECDYEEVIRRLKEDSIEYTNSAGFLLLLSQLDESLIQILRQVAIKLKYSDIEKYKGDFAKAVEKARNKVFKHSGPTWGSYLYKHDRVWIKLADQRTTRTVLEKVGLSPKDAWGCYQLNESWPDKKKQVLKEVHKRLISLNGKPLSMFLTDLSESDLATKLVPLLTYLRLRPEHFEVLCRSQTAVDSMIEEIIGFLKAKSFYKSGFGQINGFIKSVDRERSYEEFLKKEGGYSLSSMHPSFITFALNLCANSPDKCSSAINDLAELLKSNKELHLPFSKAFVAFKVQNNGELICRPIVAAMEEVPELAKYRLRDYDTYACDYYPFFTNFLAKGQTFGYLVCDSEALIEFLIRIVKNATDITFVQRGARREYYVSKIRTFMVDVSSSLIKKLAQKCIDEKQLDPLHHFFCNISKFREDVKFFIDHHYSLVRETMNTESKLPVTKTGTVTPRYYGPKPLRKTIGLTKLKFKLLEEYNESQVLAADNSTSFYIDLSRPATRLPAKICFSFLKQRIVVDPYKGLSTSFYHLDCYKTSLLRSSSSMDVFLKELLKTWYLAKQNPFSLESLKNVPLKKRMMISFAYDVDRGANNYYNTMANCERKLAYTIEQILKSYAHDYAYGKQDIDLLEANKDVLPSVKISEWPDKLYPN